MTAPYDPTEIARLLSIAPNGYPAFAKAQEQLAAARLVIGVLSSVLVETQTLLIRPKTLYGGEARKKLIRRIWAVHEHAAEALAMAGGGVK